MNFVMISKKTKADDSAFAMHGSNQRAKQNLLLNDGIIAAGSAETDFPDQCFQNRSFQFPAVFKEWMVPSVFCSCRSDCENASGVNSF